MLRIHSRNIFSCTTSLIHVKKGPVTCTILLIFRRFELTPFKSYTVFGLGKLRKHAFLHGIKTDCVVPCHCSQLKKTP